MVKLASPQCGAHVTAQGSPTFQICYIVLSLWTPTVNIRTTCDYLEGYSARKYAALKASVLIQYFHESADVEQ